MTLLALHGTRIFTGDRFIEDHAVLIEGSRIAAVMREDDIPGLAQKHRLAGGILAPGFIDLQVNGGGGALLNETPSIDTVRRIAMSHRKFGTAGLLPTVITDAPSVMMKAAGAVRDAKCQGVPGILGVHIEGPFIDPERKGAHAVRFIREMTEEDVRLILALDCGSVMLTVAPNKVRPELVRELVRHGVTVSLGHAEASHAEAELAVRSGARAFTHLFNAMSQMNGREPGMVGTALSDPECFASIIADGHHVHDAAMKVAFAAKPYSRMFLITDAMPTAAGGPGHFELQGRKVLRNDGRLQLEDGTLAGSDLTMDKAVRYCVNRLKLDLGETLNMAALTPARLIGKDHELGRIAPGHLASIVHLSDDLKVLATWIDGAL
jgi:N-acetylglucosamine-6-phosphate deacetylase